MIISREKEQKKLRDLYESGRAEFVAVYGRRGVGKTFLIDEVNCNCIELEKQGTNEKRTVGQKRYHGQRFAE
jgi:Cdc6-like AAA superfamily ATPase